MTRSGAIARGIIGAIAAIAVLGAVLIFGVIGVSKTVAAGAQVRVCGEQLGVNVSGATVSLLGTSAQPLSAGERARVSPLCVIEIERIDAADVDSGEDGAGNVKLRWKLW